MIDQKFREGVAAHAKRNVILSIVGIAKQSAAPGRLAVALELEATFHKAFPCYVKVPKVVLFACWYLSVLLSDGVRRQLDPEREDAFERRRASLSCSVDSPKDLLTCCLTPYYL